jgi:NAD-dependent deacetylase
MEIGALASDGAAFRPHIVWFGEAVPLIGDAIELVKQADIVIVIGTSLVVYPAAGLLEYVKRDAALFVVDKKIPASPFIHNAKCFEMPATKGIEQLLHELVVQPGFIQ